MVTEIARTAVQATHEVKELAEDASNNEGAKEFEEAARIMEQVTLAAVSSSEKAVGAAEKWGQKALSHSHEEDITV